MRITDIRETAIPLKSSLRNSSFDFSEMTTSVVAVITDVMRDGKPVMRLCLQLHRPLRLRRGDAGALHPAHPAADPDTLLDASGHLDPEKILACMMQREKAGGHAERSIAIGTIEVAVWDALAKIVDVPLHRLLADRFNGGTCPTRCSAMSAAAGTGRGRPSPTCRTRCAAISMPATRW